MQFDMSPSGKRRRHLAVRLLAAVVRAKRRGDASGYTATLARCMRLVPLNEAAGLISVAKVYRPRRERAEVVPVVIGNPHFYNRGAK